MKGPPLACAPPPAHCCNRRAFLHSALSTLLLAGAVAVAAQRKTSLTGWLDQAASDWPLIIRALQNSDTLLSRLLLKPVSWLASLIF